MSQLATALKQEITRLARKEATASIKALRKANAQYRRDIATLKRETATLAKRVAFLERQEKRRMSQGAPSSVAEGRRFSRRGLASHRKALGISAGDYARLVGVSAQTIYSWERGKSKPRAQQLAALLAVRGLGKREARERLELLDS